jgi:hypothetical protein
LELALYSSKQIVTASPLSIPATPISEIGKLDSIDEED